MRFFSTPIGRFAILSILVIAGLCLLFHKAFLPPTPVFVEIAHVDLGEGATPAKEREPAYNAVVDKFNKVIASDQNWISWLDIFRASCTVIQVLIAAAIVISTAVFGVAPQQANAVPQQANAVPQIKTPFGAWLIAVLAAVSAATQIADKALITPRDRYATRSIRLHKAAKAANQQFPDAKNLKEAQGIIDSLEGELLASASSQTSS